MDYTLKVKARSRLSPIEIGVDSMELLKSALNNKFLILEDSHDNRNILIISTNEIEEAYITFNEKEVFQQRWIMTLY